MEELYLDPSHPQNANAQILGWGYAGDTGPAFWGNLYETCGCGMAQSPIDIQQTTRIALPPLEIHYVSGALNIWNNGFTIQADVGPGNFFEVDGVRYTLEQFHFHIPGEHTINGRRPAMELHLVHRDEAGNRAVIGVLLVEGAPNGWIDIVFSRMPAQMNERTACEDFNPETLLPLSRRTYRYTGSLTMPPCSEGVSWFLMTDPVEISALQVRQFSEIYMLNTRPTQPLNGREVFEDVE